jgi:hypothetical protein
MFIQRDINQRGSQRGSQLDFGNPIDSDWSGCVETKDQEGTINVSGYGYKSYPTEDYSEFRDKFSYYTSLLRTRQALEYEFLDKCHNILVLFNYITVNWEKHGPTMAEQNPSLIAIIHNKICDLSNQWPEEGTVMDGDEFYDYYHQAIFKNSLCKHKSTKPDGTIEQCMNLKCNTILNYPDTDPKTDPKHVRNLYCRGHNDYNHEKRGANTQAEITECLQKLPTVLCESIGSYVIDDITPYDINEEEEEIIVLCPLC